MKRVLTGLFIVVGLVLALGIALFVGTRGDYPVAKLVTDTPSLPSAHVGGIQLHMRVAEGPEGAPVIIVLHGGPGDDFRSLLALEALSDQFSVVFYDQRGAGLSERVSTDLLTLNGHLEELQDVIDLFSPDDDPVLIGHSWGAMLASAYLSQNPNKVRAAVLIEPGYLDPEGQEAWHEQSRNYLSGIIYWRDAVLTGFRAQHVSGPDPAAADDFLIGHMVGVFANHPDNPYHCGAGYTAPNWRFGALSNKTWDQASLEDLEALSSGAARFDGPVLVMAGACNSWTGAAQQERHLGAFKRARLTVISDAGHSVIWDNPRASLTEIRAFLRPGQSK